MKRLVGSVFFAVAGILVLASCGTSCPSGQIYTNGTCQYNYNTQGGYNQYPYNQQNNNGYNQYPYNQGNTGYNGGYYGNPH